MLKIRLLLLLLPLLSGCTPVSREPKAEPSMAEQVDRWLKDLYGSDPEKARTAAEGLSRVNAGGTGR